MFDGQRCELIDGELISNMGAKESHIVAATLVLNWLAQTFGLLRVRAQAPMDVAPEDNPTSEPEPDLVVLSLPILELAGRRPQPPEVVLVVEVADTTLAFDTAEKARLYARAGFSDYWVLDARHRSILVHRASQSGVYRSIQAYAEHEVVAPLAAPGAPVTAAKLCAPS